MSSRWWYSADGKRSIDLAAVVDSWTPGEEDPVGFLFAGIEERQGLGTKADADSFLAALRAWREEESERRDFKLYLERKHRERRMEMDAYDEPQREEGAR